MAVSRKALIILCPGKPGTSSYLQGVNKDGPLYKGHLLSSLGGSWETSEIQTLSDPSKSQVISAVETLRHIDYSMVIFSGHGYYSSGKRSTILELTSGVELDSIELNAGANKRTIILDCCRVVHEEPLLEKMMKSFAMDSAPSVVNTRPHFDKKVSECPQGIVKLFSCSIDETSGDNSQRGGVYSYSLIDAADEWAKSGGKDTEKYFYTMDVVNAHAGAATRVQKLTGGRQNPAIEKPRSEPYFPFAIVA